MPTTGAPCRRKILIGLGEETILRFEDNVSETLRLGGIERQTFYKPETGGHTVMLDHWREHVVSDDGSENIVAEWQLTFSTATLSPEGTSGWLPGLFHRQASKSRRDVVGNIGIQYSGEHALSKSIEALTANVEALTVNVQGLTTNGEHPPKRTFMHYSPLSLC